MTVAACKNKWRLSYKSKDSIGNFHPTSKLSLDYGHFGQTPPLKCGQMEFLVGPKRYTIFWNVCENTLFFVGRIWDLGEFSRKKFSSVPILPALYIFQVYFSLINFIFSMVSWNWILYYTTILYYWNSISVLGNSISDKWNWIEFHTNENHF